MPEARPFLNLGNISFDDVIDGTPKIPLPTKDKTPENKQPDVVIPDKPEDTPEPKVEAPKEPVIETSVYDEIAKITGYEIEGEFDDSIEGVAEYAKAVGEKMAEEEMRDLFDSFPDVKEYLQFRLNNGDPAKFFEAKYADTDYSNLVVDEKDEVTQEVIVRKYMASVGDSQEEINETIKDYKDTGLLFKHAKRAADKLIDSHKTRRDSIITSQQEAARIAERGREEMVAQISDVVDKGSLHNLVIPEKDRKEFKQWLLQPDSKGQTKRQATMNQLTMQQKLELEYLAFKGFDLNDLVRKEATKTKIEFLKKSTTKTSRLGGTGKEQKPTGSLLAGLKATDLF